MFSSTEGADCADGKCPSYNYVYVSHTKIIGKHQTDTFFHYATIDIDSTFF